MASFARPPSKLIELLSDGSPNLNLTIVDTILFHLNIADIYSTHATCRSLRWLVDYMTESPRLLSITKQLRPFSNNPTCFRSELGKHGGLIGGDFVRNFFEFGRYEDDWLVIYIERGAKCQGFIRYLLQHEGYRATSEKIIFRRDTTPNVHVLIKGTRDPPVVDIVSEARTTADLNFMSWNKAYSLLPVPTVVLHKFYPVKPFDDAFGEALQQQTKYGWTTRDLLWPDLTTKYVSAEECRQIGGRRSLVIKLGDTPPGTYIPDHVLEGYVFAVTWRNMSTTRRLSVTMRPGTSSKALYYPHTSGGTEGYECADWERFLQDQLDRWTYVEVIKLDRAQRPPGFYHMEPGNYRVYIPVNYQLPETWDYADDQMIPWFQEWEKGWRSRSRLLN